MSIGNQQMNTFDYAQISATTNVSGATNGYLGGIFVSSVSGSPTITVYDEATSGTTTKLIDTFTPVAATWYPMPAHFRAGCNVVIGATVSCTVMFNRP